MKTTIAFYYGDIKDEHKNLQTYLIKLGTKGFQQSSGYAVEEKGLTFDDIQTVKANQTKRFARDPRLLRIDILEPGCAPVILLRESV